MCTETVTYYFGLSTELDALALNKIEHELIYYPKINKMLLFDLKNDPQEMRNLAELETYASKVAELKTALRLMQEEMGDELTI